MLDILPKRLREKIEVRGTCWIWIGRLNRNGYGRTRWMGREPVTHRLIYELLVGPIPSGLLLDHVRDHCRSRACCNPAHMEPVTALENTLRGNAVLMRPKHAYEALKCQAA